MSKKLILYSKGQLFERYKSKLHWKQITAIIDKNALNNEIIMGKPVVKPSDIDNYEYDYIVIFSNKYFYEILDELVYFRKIDFKKIVSWRALFDSHLIVDESCIKSLCSRLCNNRVLIAEADVLDKYILNRESIGGMSDTILDACCSGEINNRKYDDVYFDYNECMKNDYDIIIIPVCKDIKSFIRVKNWKKLIILVPYSISENNYDIISQEIGDLNYRIYVRSNGWIWEIDNIATKIPSDEKKEMSVYVVTHKDYPQIKNDDCYIPLCVGEKYKNSKYVSELNGKNIAYLNDKINECTGLYWIWKNTKENIVGLNHYRRYFSRGIINNRADILLSYEIYQMMNKYDMVLPVDEGFDITVKQQLVNTIPDKKIAELGISIMRNSIMQKQPDYLAFFDDVMNSYNFYRCNMFITRREILNQYCEWLFSFLIDAAEQIDVSETDEYSKRIIGFLAERMLTVWLRKNPQKIKAVPYLLL